MIMSEIKREYGRVGVLHFAHNSFYHLNLKNRFCVENSFSYIDTEHVFWTTSADRLCVC